MSSVCTGQKWTVRASVQAKPAVGHRVVCIATACTFSVHPSGSQIFACSQPRAWSHTSVILSCTRGGSRRHIGPSAYARIGSSAEIGMHTGPMQMSGILHHGLVLQSSPVASCSPGVRATRGDFVAALRLQYARLDVSSRRLRRAGRENWSGPYAPLGQHAANPIGYPSSMLMRCDKYNTHQRSDDGDGVARSDLVGLACSSPRAPLSQPSSSVTVQRRCAQGQRAQERAEARTLANSRITADGRTRSLPLQHC
eukprot:3708305-Pleurochrysis_carterae.AAC.2